MLPLEFDDKTAALTGAFLNRFTIGFVIGAACLPVPAWVNGLIFGILLSAEDIQTYLKYYTDEKSSCEVRARLARR
jgi:hypothetical protein